MGVFDDTKDDDPNRPAADFSDVRAGSGSSSAGASSSGGTTGGNPSRADFSDVQAASSSAPVEKERTYTVVAGDSLSKIAKREYGDAAKWRGIWEANRDTIKNPDLIHPGQVLNLPADL